VPGVDLVPFCAMAVASVYRKAKQAAVQGAREDEQKQHVLTDAALPSEKLR
jgi:hypothetical protein